MLGYCTGHADPSIDPVSLGTRSSRLKARWEIGCETGLFLHSTVQYSTHLEYRTADERKNTDMDVQRRRPLEAGDACPLLYEGQDSKLDVCMETLVVHCGGHGSIMDL